MTEIAKRRVLNASAIALAIGAVVVFVGYPLWGDKGPHAAVGLAWASLVVALGGIVINRPLHQTGWRLAAATIAVGAAADTWLILIGRPGDYSYGPVLLGYVGCYVLGMVAFLWHLKSWTARHYAAMALDGAILAVALLTILGSLAVPGLMDPAVSWELKAAAVVFPTLDAVILASLIRAMTSGVAADAGISLTRLALFPLIGYHVVVIHNMREYPRPNTWADELWVLCFVIIAIAVTRPKTGRTVLEFDPGLPTMGISELQAVVLAVSLVATPLTVLAYGITGAQAPWAVIGTGGLATAVLAGIRMRALLQEVEIRQREAARLALTDPLTGVPNRRAWDRHLRSAMRRNQDRLWVAMLDLDWFKNYNDAHGHQAGDDLLRQAAQRWQSALPTDAVLARYGGEEFALLLWSEQAHEVVATLHRVRRLTPMGQTCSVGVARWNSALNGDELMAAADAALYLAKAAGRDQLVVADSPQPARERPVPLPSAGRPTTSRDE